MKYCVRCGKLIFFFCNLFPSLDLFILHSVLSLSLSLLGVQHTRYLLLAWFNCCADERARTHARLCYFSYKTLEIWVFGMVNKRMKEKKKKKITTRVCAMKSGEARARVHCSSSPHLLILEIRFCKRLKMVSMMMTLTMMMHLNKTAAASTKIDMYSCFFEQNLIAWLLLALCDATHLEQTWPDRERHAKYCV